MTADHVLDTIYHDAIEDLRMVADTLEDDGWEIRWIWDFGSHRTAFEADRGDRIVGIQVSNVVANAVRNAVEARWTAFAINGCHMVYSSQRKDLIEAMREVI